MKEYYVDYRFIVKAEDDFDAANKVDAMISDATDDVWYTIDKIVLREEQ